MQKLFESYLAGLILHETRGNPTPLLDATALPDVFVIRDAPGAPPTLIRVHVTMVSGVHPAATGLDAAEVVVAKVDIADAVADATASADNVHTRRKRA